MATAIGDEIGLDQSSMIGALVLVQFVGIPFSFAFGGLAKKLGTKKSILLGLGVYCLISIGGFFMSETWHFWVLAFMVGLVQGGTQALSRSLFGRMIPKAKSGEFFGFFSMSDKFAGIFGPMVLGFVALFSGSSQVGIASLIVFFVLGAIMLLRVDEEKGFKDAEVVEA